MSSYTMSNFTLYKTHGLMFSWQSYENPVPCIYHLYTSFAWFLLITLWFQWMLFKYLFFFCCFYKKFSQSNLLCLQKLKMFFLDVSSIHVSFPFFSLVSLFYNYFFLILLLLGFSFSTCDSASFLSCLPLFSICYYGQKR